MARSSDIKAALRPLPMRITPIQYDRLLAARIRDGRTIQEHVRKALDVYLDQLDRVAARSNGQTPVASELPPDKPRVGDVVQRAVTAARAKARPAAPAVRQR